VRLIDADQLSCETAILNEHFGSSDDGAIDLKKVDRASFVFVLTVDNPFGGHRHRLCGENRMIHRPESERLMSFRSQGASHRAHESTDCDVPRSVSADQSLEQCLLDTQRHVSQLEEIAHRLAKLSFPSLHSPPSAIALLHEANRRLSMEVEEFSRDVIVVQHLAASHSQYAGQDWSHNGS
jgi:hypothetical protein